MTIAENIDRVRENMALACQRAGRDPQEVKLIAVSKYVEPVRIAEAFSAGVKAVGENHDQEVREKLTFYKQNQAELHFIGQLQSNKVKYIIGNARLIHSVDRESLLLCLDEQAQKRQVKQPILIQVNIGGEAQKGGVSPEKLPLLLELCCGRKNLKAEGLMCVPPAGEQARSYFRAMLALQRRMQELFPELSLNTLSMGMSHDYEQAIEEGATLIRVGTAIFGRRDRL